MRPMRPMRPMIAIEDDDDRHDGAGTHRWMVSYADFVTLLFVLFMVLYAKAPRLPAAAPPEAIRSAPEPQLPVSVPDPVVEVRSEPEPEPKPEPKPEPRAVADAPAPTEPSAQQPVLEGLARSLADLTAAGNVVLFARKDGVVLEISDTSLFASGTAQPAPQAGELIDKIAAAIGQGKNPVIVEGHTDNVPIKTSQYPSNWELSSARAASVVRALQERGISPDRLAASGLAQTRPRSSNDTERGRSENRRVSLIVLNP